MRASFPHLLLRQELTPRRVGLSQEPQQSINGTDTVVPSFGGRWEATATFVIRGEAAQLSWQAFLAQMEGRIGTTLVPITTRFRPRDRDGRPICGNGPAGLAGAQTFEHFGFGNAPVATLALAAPAALRATVIKATLRNTTGIRPGQFFSIGERLYQVQQHWEDAEGVASLMIWPPLRQAAGTGSTLILDRPVCLMRMASEKEGEFDHLLDRLPRVAVNFVEAI